VVPQEPDCVITVSGADRAGIVHAVTDVLAAHAASIVDVSTRARETEDGDVYMMALEVASGGKGESLRASLQAVAEKLAVDVEMHELEEAII